MVKKTDLNSKISEVESKIPSITNLATSSALTAVENKIPVSSLIKKRDFDAKLKTISDRVNLLAENELKKLNAFDLSYSRGKNYFEDSGTLTYLVFEPIDKYFKRIIGVGNGK